jgi:hypothetical protein
MGKILLILISLRILSNLGKVAASESGEQKELIIKNVHIKFSYTVPLDSRDNNSKINDSYRTSNNVKKKITFVTGPTTPVRLGIAGSTNSSTSTNRGFGGS